MLIRHDDEQINKPLGAMQLLQLQPQPTEHADPTAAPPGSDLWLAMQAILLLTVAEAHERLCDGMDIVGVRAVAERRLLELRAIPWRRCWPVARSRCRYVCPARSQLFSHRG